MPGATPIDELDLTPQTLVEYYPEIIGSLINVDYCVHGLWSDRFVYFKNPQTQLTQMVMQFYHLLHTAYVLSAKRSACNMTSCVIIMHPI